MKRMSRIVVFDSGLGSLSIVRALQASGRNSDIIYYADRASFPYGSKSYGQLRRIISDTTSMLARRFAPDAIVIASNTPTLVLEMQDGYDSELGAFIAGVRPPIAEALRRSETGCIGILGTAAGVKSRGLARMIRDSQKTHKDKKSSIISVDCSELVGFVESGAFLSDPKMCTQKTAELLLPLISQHGIDAATLSSTHLSFLAPVLRAACPGVALVDPADGVAKHVVENMRWHNAPPTMKLAVYASGDCGALQRNLDALGVKRTVQSIDDDNVR